MEKDQLQLRRQVGQLFNMIEETQKLAETTARAQDARRTSLMPGEAIQIMDADGNVAAYFGGSNASGQLIEHVAGPEPKRPSVPELDSPMPGVITVVADGRDEYGEEAQGNHDRVLIHLSHEEGFTPSEATSQHSFFGPEGRQDVSAEPGEWYVAIQWRTKTGQLSDPSEQAFVEVLELVNSADIKATLEESRQRLADAMKDFEEGNNTRKEEIKNLNEVVLPALEQSLTDAMTELEERVGSVDLSRLEDALTELNETRLPALREDLEGGLSDEVTRLEGLIESAGGSTIMRGVDEPVDASSHDNGTYYFQYDTLDADGNLVAMWVVSNGAWTKSDLDEAILPQVHVEQGTYGELHGGRLIANSIETSALAVNDWENLIVDSDLRELRSAELINESNKVSTQWGSVALSGNHWTAQETNSGRTYIVAPEDDQYSALTFAKSGVGIPATAGESFLISMEGEGEITDVTFQIAGMDENYQQTFFVNAIEGAVLGTEFQTEFTIPEDTSTGLPTEVFQLLIQRGNDTAGSGRWRITQFRRKTPGVLIEDGAIKANNIDVEEVFANEVVANEVYANAVRAKLLEAEEALIGGTLLKDGAVTTRSIAAEAVKAANIDVQSLVADEAFVNTVWADVVRAGLLTAEEALIGGALLKDGIIDADKINAESVTAAVAQFLRIQADMLEANAIDGMTITGSTTQTRAEAQRGIKMRAAENDLVAYDQDSTQSFRVDGDTGQLTARGAEFQDGTVTGSNVVGGYVGTAESGKRVYLQGDSLTARDSSGRITSQFSPDGISLLDGAGNLQSLGSHIYGGVTLSSYHGSKGSSGPLGSATDYGNYLGATWPNVITASHTRYRTDVSFNILAHGRAANSDGWIDFWIIPRTPDDATYGGSLFRREVYIGAPMFDVSLNYSMTQIIDLPRTVTLGSPMRLRWQMRNKGLSLCRISNLTVTLTPA